MPNDPLNNLLRDWANDQLPDDERRNRILRRVFERPRHRRYRRVVAAALSGIIAVAAMLFFLVTPPPTTTIVRESAETPQNSTIEEYRVSLLVLRRLGGSDSAVEFLEDTLFLAEDQKLYDIPLEGHRFFLWIHSLEEDLLALDVGIDKAAETGLAVPLDQTQALELQSNGDQFEVFISVLPHS